MGGYSSSPDATPPRPTSAMSASGGLSSSFERVEHEAEEQQLEGNDHPHIPSQSFVGLGRSLSLSASSVLSSVTGASSLLMTSTEAPVAALPEADEVDEAEAMEEDDWEQIPPTPSPFSLKLDALLNALLKPKGLLSAMVVYLSIYWRLRGTYMEGQAQKWEARFHEEVRRGNEANVALKAALAQVHETMTALYTCQEEQSKCCVTKSPTLSPYQGSDNATKRAGGGGGGGRGGDGKVVNMDGGETTESVVHVPPLNKKTRAHAAAGHRDSSELTFASARASSSSSSSSSSSTHQTCDLGAEPLTLLDNCILHLQAGPCTTEAMQHLSGCVGHVLTSSELVLKDVLRHGMGMAQGTVHMASSLFDSMEGFVDEAASLAVRELDGWMDMFVGGKNCEYTDEEERE